MTLIVAVICPEGIVLAADSKSKPPMKYVY